MIIYINMKIVLRHIGHRTVVMSFERKAVPHWMLGLHWLLPRHRFYMCTIFRNVSMEVKRMANKILVLESLESLPEVPGSAAPRCSEVLPD